MHDHGDLAVHLVQLQSLIDVHGFPCRDVIENDTLMQSADTEHVIWRIHFVTSSKVMIKAILI